MNALEHIKQSSGVAFMKRTAGIVLTLALLWELSGCAGAGSQARYDTDGIACLTFSDIDTVCEDAALTEAGQRLLSGQGDSLLLSYVVDSAILLSEAELGGYDHLVMANPQWMERFGDPGRLKPVDPDSLPGETRDFLTAQMPVLTADGSVLPDGVALYRYEGGGLLAFPPGVTLGWAEPVTAKNPLIILVDDPPQALRPGGCTLPLASSGNILFADPGRLEAAFRGSGLEPYAELQTFGSADR